MIELSFVQQQQKHGNMSQDDLGIRALKRGFLSAYDDFQRKLRKTTF